MTKLIMRVPEDFNPLDYEGLIHSLDGFLNGNVKAMVVPGSVEFSFIEDDKDIQRAPDEILVYKVKRK